ncbi:hypothetical protein [Mycobacterium sp. IS-1556]|uniref:hypothetical protein n=1 Tax=Mycobacterium sp. IS-1556 TaxID=1772276 RepID=UPI0007415EEA|nr:hypothetical protein [Mycobacterium sp. IS-1556]KUH84786.1 hypothetical protein AU187_19925 [Mycobacterium sp. IS-1556]
MGLQDDAARMLVEALSRRRLGTSMAHGMTPSVSITAYPHATVYFKLDGLGGLRTEFVFDGRPPEILNYMPTAADADALADYTLKRVAGEGGRPPA